jgi:hypothetical protein
VALPAGSISKNGGTFFDPLKSVTNKYLNQNLQEVNVTVFKDRQASLTEQITIDNNIFSE